MKVFDITQQNMYCINDRAVTIGGHRNTLHREKYRKENCHIQYRKMMDSSEQQILNWHPETLKTVSK